MSRSYEVEVQLSKEEVDQLRSEFRKVNGTMTVDDMFERCQAMGFSGSRTAVGNWMAKERGEIQAERMSRNSELATAIKSAIGGGNFDDITAAANMQLVQIVFEQASRLQVDGDLDAEQIMLMTQSLKNLVGTKAQHTKLLADKFEQEMQREAKTAKTPEDIFTPERIAAARKRIFGV
jgi:hypothetical protein